jgi:P27 family predicted phage terminase small subunit
MGRRGPLAKSKLYGGAWLAAQQKAAASPAEVKKLLQPPPGLTPGALARWQELAPLLVADHRLRRETRECFYNFCRMADEVDRLTDQVLAEGHVVQTSHGRLPNPLCKVLSSTRTCLLKYGQVLGLDPASHARLESAGVLKNPPTEEDEEFERLFMA